MTGQPSILLWPGRLHAATVVAGANKLTEILRRVQVPQASRHGPRRLSGFAPS